MFRSICLASAIILGAGFSHGVVGRAGRVAINDNRRPAGTLSAGVLTVHLEVRPGEWHPNGDDGPGADMLAFAEIGKAPEIPGPLIRAAVGTRVSATVRNSLPNDTLLVHGLYSRESGAAEAPPIQLLPGETRGVQLRLGAPGTYYYWATTMRRTMRYRVHEDAELTGAIVVDPPGPVAPDRVFVIGMWSDTTGGAMPHGRKRELATINGRSWPNTERLEYTVGDTVRFRVINATSDLHPMHLHGFYFRIDARGNETADTAFAGDYRERAVTELVQIGGTLRLTWVPDRDGNWAFHCHIPEHIEARGPLGMLVANTHDHAVDHAAQAMGGLVIGMHVRPRAGQPSTADRAAPASRRLRLVAQDRANVADAAPLRFTLGEGNAAPSGDSASRIGPSIVVRLGEPVSIMVVNRSSHPTSVHWHGMELESYFDGIGGFSGTPTRLAPVIAPRDSFEARFTPPRAGTFIYHTHVDEGRQQPAGLVGALIVLAPGERYDPETDVAVVFTSPPDSLEETRAVLTNGVLKPGPLTLRLGRPYRLRFVNITTARPGFRIEVRHDTSLVAWRPLARDGADLPEGRRVARPAVQPLTIGQTMDFELTPRTLGDLRIATVANAGVELAALVLRVVP